MELTGKIIKVLELKEGTSERGPWARQDYVLETDGQYPKKMVFTVMGRDRIARFNIQALMNGDKPVMVSFDINAREYDGKWYNSVTAWDVRQVNDAPVEIHTEKAEDPFPPEQPKVDVAF